MSRQRRGHAAGEAGDGTEACSPSRPQASLPGRKQGYNQE